MRSPVDFLGDAFESLSENCVCVSVSLVVSHFVNLLLSEVKDFSVEVFHLLDQVKFVFVARVLSHSAAIDLAHVLASPGSDLVIPRIFHESVHRFVYKSINNSLATETSIEALSSANFELRSTS